MRRNIRIARQLLKIAKELVALNENVDKNVINHVRKEFEKDLKDDSNSYNKIAQRSNEYPLEEKTLDKCLETFDKIMKDMLEKSSFSTQNVNNVADRYEEEYGNDLPNHCKNIFYKLIKDESKVLGLKESN